MCAALPIPSALPLPYAACMYVSLLQVPVVALLLSNTTDVWHTSTERRSEINNLVAQN